MRQRTVTPAGKYIVNIPLTDGTTNYLIQPNLNGCTGLDEGLWKGEGPGSWHQSVAASSLGLRNFISK